MADDAQNILTPIQADNSVKADAWQAFKDSANERQFGAKLQGINLPREVKADLWEAKRKAGASAQVPSFADAANQAKQQVLSKMGNISEYPELQNAKPSGPSTGGRFGGSPMREPDSGATLNALPAVGGTIGGTLGGIPGATLGGGAGEAAKQLIQRAAGDQVTDTPATDITEQGAIMGAAQGVGQHVISPLIKWIAASKTVGAKLLQVASSKAGNAPVELSPETNAIIDDVVRQSKLGGRAPKIVSDLLERLGPSTKQAADAVPGPLTYDEARIAQGNLSTMSVNEINDLKGQLKYLMPKLARSFSQDVQAAADQAGIGAEHAQGMKEYATAASRDRTLSKAIKYGAGTVGAGAATDILLRKLGKAK